MFNTEKSDTTNCLVPVKAESIKPTFDVTSKDNFEWYSDDLLAGPKRPIYIEGKWCIQLTT